MGEQKICDFVALLDLWWSRAYVSILQNEGRGFKSSCKHHFFSDFFMLVTRSSVSFVERINKFLHGRTFLVCGSFGFSLFLFFCSLLDLDIFAVKIASGFG